MDEVRRQSERVLFRGQEMGSELTSRTWLGYRELLPAEIKLINRVRARAEQVRELIEEIERLPVARIPARDRPPPLPVEIGIDPRWVEIARTDIQTGFMALVRSIGRPETF